MWEEINTMSKSRNKLFRTSEVHTEAWIKDSGSQMTDRKYENRIPERKKALKAGEGRGASLCRIPCPLSSLALPPERPDRERKE